MTKTRVLLYGLGPIGMGLGRLALQRPGLDLVGAVDIAPALQGQDVGLALGSKTPLGVAVSGDAAAVLAQTRPHVVLHATGSRLPAVQGQFMGILRAGVHVVSTCEELVYPFPRYPHLTAELDAAAQAHSCSIMGVGVNPGFLMDKFVATLLSACQEVEHVAVHRVVDAARRRGPLQKKVGAGMTPAEFQTLVDAGELGHVGLPESAHMLADVLGLPAGREVVQVIGPKVAEQAAKTPFVHVRPGQVAGVDQTARVLVDGVERVHLHLEMYIGAQEPMDKIWVRGKPNLELAVTSGVHGDLATIALAVNCVPLMAGLRPGLRTVLDAPIRFAP